LTLQAIHFITSYKSTSTGDDNTAWPFVVVMFAGVSRNCFVVLSILFANSICKMSLSKTQIFLFFESGNYVKECLCLIDTHLVGELFFRFHNMILPSAQIKKYGGRDSFRIAKTEAF